MKSFLLLALICGVFHQAYTDTCTECEAALKDNTDCSQLGSYMTCLTTAAGDGCDTIHTKMDTANRAATTNKCTVTDTCQCQVAYFKTDLTAGDAAKCTALKNELICMYSTTEASCDTKIAADAAFTTVKDAAGGITDCFTGTACECETTLVKSRKDCTAYKAALKCLFKKEKTTPCDGGSFTNFVNTTKQSGLALDNCLTSTCQCEASYYSKDLSTDDLTCDALKKELICMFGTSDASCDDGINAVTTFNNVKAAAATISDCFTGTACECEATLMKSSKDCQADKDALKCLFAAHVTNSTTTPCDGGNFAALVNTTKQSGLGESNCLTSLCECHASYYVSDLTTNPLICKAVSDFETCTTSITASDLSCDGSSTLTVVETFMNATKTAAMCGGGGARVQHVPVLVAVVMLMSWTLK